MNLSDSDRLELSELCSALVDGIADKAQRARLETMLAESEDARRLYVRTMALSASLHEYAGEMQAEAPDAVPANERQVKWWAVSGLAAAAAIFLAFWFGTVRQPEHETDEIVARVSGAKDCVWGGSAFSPGDDLPRGQRIELTAGVAEITFDSGAQVTIEGPAILTLVSEWEATLGRGTLKANVPTEAVGFRVSNPDVDVVDLGTEFSMVADAGGGTEVFVTKGAVEVHGRADAAQVLRENEARRFGLTGSSDVRDHEQKLVRLARKVSLDRLVRPPNFVHWSFDETDAALFTSTGATSHDAHIEGGRDFADIHSAGRFAGALHLSEGLFAKAAIPDLAKRTARTAAFWVKVPADAALPDAGALLAWPSVEIAWNRNPDRGALGALRTDAGRGYVIGSTPLRDGRWHHIAVVVTPGRKTDGMQVRQYVDGRLEVVSAKRGKRAGAIAKDTASSVLWIGRARDGSRFRGELDELFLADRALSPPEIRYLMLRNKPAQAETLATN